MGFKIVFLVMGLTYLAGIAFVSLASKNIDTAEEVKKDEKQDFIAADAL